jgi:hypothetical protein
MPATRTSWKHEPFTNGTSFPCQRTFSDEEFAKIRNGLIPLGMEDQWFIFYEEPYLYFHRSWTGRPCYRLKLAPATQGRQVSQAAFVISADRTLDFSYQAALLDFLISNLLLGEDKPCPVPPEVEKDKAAIYQHAVSGTGYPTVVANARKPWWRFW